jgi:Ca2+-binding RTX toxin-like protein
MSNPQAGGTIRNLLQGDEGQRMLDNITVGADGKLVMQEDPGNTARYAKVWSYDPAKDSLVQIGEHDNVRFSGAVPPFNQDEESSGVIDVTKLLGDGTNQAFLLDVQAHYTLADPALVEGGQLLAMYVDTPKNGDFGANAVNGSSSADTLFAFAGADTVRGGSGDDLLNGDDGDDIVSGNKGADNVRGGAGADTLYGGQGADTLYGEAGNDLASGDVGNDILFGGAGADRVALRSGGGTDWVGDFNSAEGDRIQIAPGVAYTVTSYLGQAVISIATGEQIGLAGVSIAQMGDWLLVA